MSRLLKSSFAVNTLALLKAAEAAMQTVSNWSLDPHFPGKAYLGSTDGYSFTLFDFDGDAFTGMVSYGKFLVALTSEIARRGCMLAAAHEK